MKDNAGFTKEYQAIFCKSQLLDLHVYMQNNCLMAQFPTRIQPLKPADSITAPFFVKSKGSASGKIRIFHGGEKNVPLNRKLKKGQHLYIFISMLSHLQAHVDMNPPNAYSNCRFSCEKASILYTLLYHNHLFIADTNMLITGVHTQSLGAFNTSVELYIH